MHAYCGMSDIGRLGRLGGCSDNFTSDDIPERYGRFSNDFLKALKSETISNFADETGSKLLRYVQDQTMPFLELEISDSKDWQTRIKALQNVNLEFHKTPFIDVLRIPQRLRSGERINVSLPVACLLSEENINLAIAASTLYVEICDLGFENYHSRRPTFSPKKIGEELKARELEIFTWAVVGKTLEDIAEITNLSYATVRYHLANARDRYGYANLWNLSKAVAWEHQFGSR